MRSLLMASALAVVISTTAAAADKIVVEFGYPYPHLFDVTYEKQIKKFKKAHPNIEIKMEVTLFVYPQFLHTRETNRYHYILLLKLH